MPKAPRTLCPCGGIKTADVCDRCGAKPQQYRKSTTERGYGGDWQRLSKRSRQAIPFCVRCWMDERITTAEPGKPLHSHHVIKIVDAPHLRLDDDNVVVVCAGCNKRLDALYERNRHAYDREAVELKRTRDSLLRT